MHVGPRSTQSNRAGRRHALARTGVVAVAAALATTGGLGSALAAPSGPAVEQAQATLSADQLAELKAQLAAQSDSGRPAGLPESGPASFFLQIDTPSTSQVYADTLAESGEAQAADAARAAQSDVEAATGDVVAELPAAVSGAEVLYTASTVVSGVAVSADAADYAALRTLPGVTAVLPITPKKTSNTGAAAVVRAVDAWESLGNTGKDVSVGIIDTGIDYTHADFGGSGDVAQFDAIQAAEKAPAPAGVFPSAKVVGGHDFVGDDYNADPADPAYQPVAHEDDNPLDCNGHGTHVAGTSAGFGVNADGSTYTGTYGPGFDAGALKIGPGMAPEASLYALKVFGCEGSTDVTIKALEWAMDPNGDGSIDDHLDVVNLSLGSDYGLADDADAMVADAAMAHGMLVVLAAGNAGDSYDIGGSPGNAPRAIGVAASNDGYGVFDGWRVDSPAGVVDGVRPGLRSIAYKGTGDVTGPLVLPPAGHEDGCTLPAGYTVPAGSIQLFLADGFSNCGSVGKGTNAVKAGAAGFMIVGDDDLLETGITGVAQIPGILVTKTDGDAVIAAVTAGKTVTVTFGDSLKDASVFTAPEQVDLLASFSSRGTRQANGLKPDVSAPGVTLFSAAVGTGSQGVSESGTSMATPTTAGVTALIRAAHPEWTTEEVKADLMNTAGHDVHTADGTVYGPNRQGAGRIDAKAALDNQVLAYANAGSGVVSASFGVIEATDDKVVQIRQITLSNKSSKPVGYKVAYEALADQPGVTYRVEPSIVNVAANTKTAVNVVLTVDRAKLRKTADPTVDIDSEANAGRQFVGEASGRVLFTPKSGNAPSLRVPVHSNAKPSSNLTAQNREPGKTIALVGRGVSNGPAFGLNSYTSLAAVFERLGSSPKMAKCTTVARTDCYKSELERSVDLASVGVASDVAASPKDPSLYFGVSAHGKFTSAQTAVNYAVYVDATGDGAWDYQVTTTRITDYDAPLVVVSDRAGDLMPSNDDPYIGYMNVAPGTVDTNALDSDVQVLPVPLSAMPLITSAASRVTFGVQSSSAYGTVDNVGTTVSPSGTSELAGQAMSFDPLHPGLSFTSGGQPAILTSAQSNTMISISQDPAAYAADVSVGGAKGAMVVVLQNDSGRGRTQFVPVEQRRVP
ncbi:S8 family serine peptidase [Modestobacter sp. L9-4]|uniref:S8 family serine peptidase n=1 Tax=Modestobacter sp. L9-4 TaxID=2851567 RepID=UPI001C790E01|nr:S8 family serine peptidase [Modestobacter sp. L9-4]QXG76955.1 S8 family serine peptidase [Modestobacter sp. L9-4]